jgi:hypothetical protein
MGSSAGQQAILPGECERHERGWIAKGGCGFAWDKIIAERKAFCVSSKVGLLLYY